MACTSTRAYIVITSAHSSDESGADEDDDAIVDDDARFVAEYGLIPRMAVASMYTIAALNAESFVERVISAANMVMDEGSTALSDEELEMLVILRINRKFMEFMRANHPDVYREVSKGGAVLRAVDSETHSDDEGDD